jgi:flagellar motor switch protein FliG
MSSLIRHKRPGGFVKLIHFLETLPKEKRDKLIDNMRTEDAPFVEQVEKYLLCFEDFENFDDLKMCELVAALDMPTLAVAVYKCKNEKLVKKFVANIPRNKELAFRTEGELLDKVTVAQQNAARFKIIEAVRKIEAEKEIIFKACPKTYEEKK